MATTRGTTLSSGRQSQLGVLTKILPPLERLGMRQKNKNNNDDENDIDNNDNKHAVVRNIASIDGDKSSRREATRK